MKGKIMTTLQKTYEAHLKANAGNFNSDLFEDVSLRKEMIALHIASNPKLKASLDKQNVSYEAAAGASSDKLLEANYELVQTAKGLTEQAIDYIDTVDAGIKRIESVGDKLISDDISYSLDRVQWALGNIDWIKKNLPAILVERVFKNIESYEKRATNILESLKSK
jgi:hypothetical protein